MIRRGLATVIALGLATAAGCGSSEPRPVTPPQDDPDREAEQRRQPPKEDPPPSGEAREVSFPPIERTEVAKGLEVNTVEWDLLPIVYLQLVIRSGGETDPQDAPGLSSLVAAMLEEGTRSRSSAELAEEVEFLGADIWTGADEENVYINMRAVASHLPEAMDILADVAMNPAFRPGELDKLKKRELDRLALQENDPGFLAKREFARRLYGDHPYAHIDTTPDVVESVGRGDLARWHRKWFTPDNAFLVVVGDVDTAEVGGLAGDEFAKWRNRKLPEVEYADPPERDQREVVIVDRPESVQSVIYIGNLAIERDHEDFVELEVANQVLGGSAASRLFADLREKRSLTYGAYSGVGERVDVAPFRASASVENTKTGRAAEAFFQHLERITSEAPPEQELTDAQRYLSDSFPLKIDTPGKIASLVSELRIFDLPDDYWESYRKRIRDVEPEQARSAAQAHIRPRNSLVVVVGRAADIAESLQGWGSVTVVDTDGEVIEELDSGDDDGGARESAADHEDDEGAREDG